MLRKSSLVVRKLCISCLVCMMLGVMVIAASAAKLPAGTIITKTNLDRIRNDTFEGKTIASMLTDKVEWQIKHWGLQIKLRHAEPFKLDPRFIKATKKYAGAAKFNPQTREVTGYQAGLAFPDVSMDDPYAGDKLIWNFYYGVSSTGGMTQKCPHAQILFGSSGVERIQRWFWLRYYMKNRLDRFARGLSPVEGDGSILTKTLLFAEYPRDIRGIGTFTIRYDNPKMEDQWVYIKSARRTRRLSGGAWMDPIGATDCLQDDLICWNARPSWYPKIRLLGKRWILALAHDPHDWNKAKKGTPEEFPGIDMATWPHWNPSPKTRAWEPREVYVIEGTPPPYHPYSKRVVYMDVTIPFIYMSDCYDKRGDFWKFIHYHAGPIIAKDGYMIIPYPQGEYIDFKRRHATVHYVLGWVGNPPGVTANDCTLGQLKAAGK